MLKVKDCNLHKYNKKANNDDIFRTNRHKMKKPGHLLMSGLPKTAATYSPNWWVSTIGDGELNFSVRNG